VLLGNGDGTFQGPVAYGSGGYPANSVAVGDVNGDGHTDLIVANGQQSPTNKNGKVSVLLGSGDGTFQTAISYGSGGQGATAVAVADANGDGKLDLLVANALSGPGNGSGSVGVLLNNFIASTTTAVKSSLNPSHVNQSVTFTATITSNSSVPNGSTVTFYDGTIKIGTGTTKDGVASLTTSFSKAATHTIKARYPGDLFHKASSGSVTQVVEL
jgi:hypothetical protein